MPLLTEQGARYSPIRLEDRWFRGEDKKLIFKVTDETDAVPSFAGWTFGWFLRDRLKDTDVVLEVLNADIDIVNGPDPDDPLVMIDMVKVPITGADTLDLRVGEYQHALVRTNPGDWHVLAVGEAVLQASAAG